MPYDVSGFRIMPFIQNLFTNLSYFIDSLKNMVRFCFSGDRRVYTVALKPANWERMAPNLP